MRVFVTGATGLIGRRLVSALRQRGDAIVVLSRSPDAASSLPAGCEVVTGDPSVRGHWLDHLRGCDAVVHLAGEPIMARRWRKSFKQRLRDSRVLSTRLIAETLALHPRRADGTARVLACASGINYYGSRHGDEELDEDSPPGSDFLAGLCVEWEQASQPARDAGLRVAHLRTGLVLDPEGGALPKLMRPFRWFVGGPVASGRQWISWIHRDDEIGLILFILDNAQVVGPINGAAPEPVKNWGFCKSLARALRRPCWLPVPRFALRVLLGEAATLVADGLRVLPRRALQLGYQFRFPQLDGALRDLLSRPGT